MLAASPRPNPWRRRALRERLLTLLACLGLLAILVWSAAGSAVGKRIYDRLSIWAGFEASPDVVIIAIDERTRRTLGPWPLSRQHYADLLQRMVAQGEVPKALGIDLLFMDAKESLDAMAQEMGQVPTVLPLILANVEAPSAGAPTPGSPEQAPLESTWQLPHPMLKQAAKGLGHIHVRFDSDGTIRGIQTRLHGQPHFALAMLEAGGALAERPAPPDLYLRFPMVDPKVGFTTFPLVDLLEPGKTLPALRGKWVLVGVTDPTLGDHHATIYSGAAASGTPGVAVLASAVNAHLTQRWIRVVPDAWVFGVSAVALVLAMLALQRWSVQRLVVLGLLATLGLPALAAWGMAGWGWWFDIAPLWLTMFLLGLFWSWRRLQGNVRYMRRKTLELQAMSGQAESLMPDLGAEAVSAEEHVLDQAINLQAQQLTLLTQVMENLPEAVALLDDSGHVLETNPRMRALGLRGLAGCNCMAQLADELGLPTADWDTLVELAAQPDTSLRVKSPRGERDVYLKTTVFEGAGASRLRLLTLVDVTELKRSQAQRDEALRFLSHDMRTPVASILAVVDQMQAKARQEAGLAEDFKRVIGNANHLMGLMDGFLYESRAQSEALRLAEHLIDDVLEDAVSQVSDLARSRQMRVSLRGGDEFFFVQMSAQLMVRVFMNLLLNAVKYGQPGSTVEVLTRPAADGQAVEVCLRNEVTRDRQTVDEAIITQGFGLGLKFVHKVIERHGGHMSTHIPEHGQAQVVVTLPCTIEVN